MATHPAGPEAHAQEQDRLRLHFASTHPSQQAGRWDSLWRDGSFLPWDRGEPSPALIDLLAQRKDIIGSAFTLPAESVGNDSTESNSTQRTRRKALIPGCGIGYDCYLLHARGWDVVGLDVSETAVQQARAYQAWIESQDVFAAGELGKGSLRFESGDFFALDEEVWMGKWDLIWDYTFLCALPPDLRPKWALQMSKLLSPTGRLICLEFPSHKDLRAGGPPWGLQPQTYIALLSRPGSDINYNKEQKVLPEEQQSPGNDYALVRMVHFKPERTYAAGKDSDRVSIWRKR